MMKVAAIRGKQEPPLQETPQHREERVENGMRKARAGSARPTKAEDFIRHITLDEAMVNPRNRLPQSPMKVFAGLKLKRSSRPGGRA